MSKLQRSFGSSKNPSRKYVPPKENKSVAEKKQCPKCKSWIDCEATKCAHCRSTQPAPAWANVFAFILVMALGIWGYQSCSSFLTLSPEEQANQQKEEKFATPIYAYHMSQEFVERELLSPGSADFPWFQESFVTNLGEGRYHVKAYVDSQNSYGASLRSHYTCTLIYRGEDFWNLENLTFTD